MEPLRLTLAREPASVPDARRQVRVAMEGWGCPGDHVDAVEYVVGELVTESVEHGAGPLLVSVAEEDSTTRVEVIDGLTLSAAISGTRDEVIGLFAADSGMTDTSGGRCLWAEVEHPFHL